MKADRSLVAAPIIPAIVAQHADELASLWFSRQTLANAGHVGLRELAEHDERIAAHLDGCVVAGEAAIEVLIQLLEDPDPGRTFALGAVALEATDLPSFEHAVEVAEANEDCVAGLSSALGWVSGVRLKGVVQCLLQSDRPVRRRLGLVACGQHGVDPGPVLAGDLSNSPAEVRMEALRTAILIGRQDLRPTVLTSVASRNERIAAAAASAAVMLGERDRTLERLESFVVAKVCTRAALEIALRASSLDVARALLQQISKDAASIRALTVGAGVAGDPHYVAWLIRQMEEPKLARLAGEAFSMMTGLDLDRARLECSQPGGFESAPTEETDDSDVALDEDEGLPWPDSDKIAAWWKTNGSRFQSGIRYFMGQPPSREHCINVLKTGYQRQRIAAAQYLCLLNPGTPLFNTAAPAWRQKRLLDRLA